MLSDSMNAKGNSQAGSSAVPKLFVFAAIAGLSSLAFTGLALQQFWLYDSQLQEDFRPFWLGMGWMALTLVSEGVHLFCLARVLTIRDDLTPYWTSAKRFLQLYKAGGYAAVVLYMVIPMLAIALIVRGGYHPGIVQGLLICAAVVLYRLWYFSVLSTILRARIRDGAPVLWADGDTS